MAQQQPMLLLIKGHPGVGKSTLARRLCQELSWPLIDKDDARDSLQGLPADVLQSFDANKLSYDIMFRYCRTQLSLGISTVVDCPFARVELFDEAASIAQQFGARIAVVDCIAADTSRWQQRLEHRGRQQAGSESSHKPQTWQQIQQLLDRYGQCWQWSCNGSRNLDHHLVVDTTAQDGDNNLRRVLEFVSLVCRGAAAVTGPSGREQQ